MTTPPRPRFAPPPMLVTLFSLAALAALAQTGCSGSSGDAPSGAGSSAEPAAGESLPDGNSEPAGPEARIEPEFWLGGIQVHEAEHDAWFANLKRQGMNSVQVTDYAKQGDWDSDHMWWDEEKPWVIEEIRGAKRHGLAVVLVLRVALDHAFERNAFLWHGMISPKNDQLLASWFEQYGRFCRKWAEIAEREGVDALVIGSEMNALASTLPLDEVPPLEEYFLNPDKQDDRRSEMLAQKQVIEDRNLYLRDKESFPTVEQYLEARIAVEQQWARQTTGLAERGVAGQTDDFGNLEPVAADAALASLNARRATLQAHWRELIADLRQVYGGPMGYAANFDQYHEVGFWTDLDFMGINAYFKLRNELVDTSSPERLQALLVDGWRGVLGGIAEFRRRQGVEQKPVIFTEMGFTFRRHSTLEPWSDTGFSMIYTPTALDDGSEGEPEKTMIVWRDEPVDYLERAMAVRALHQAHGELPTPLLDGILYWKLSSHDYHLDDESFMVHVGPESEDPILPALRAFLPSSSR